MGNQAVALSAAALAVVVAGIIWTHEARKGEVPTQGISQNETFTESNESVEAQGASQAVGKGVNPDSSTPARNPFPEVPKTRDGMSFDNDPGYAENKAEQKWLDRHGFPNQKQLEAYMGAPEALLKQASEAGDKVAQTILDARLLPSDPMAQQRLVDAGAEGNLFALNMLASFQGGSSSGDPVAAYAVSRVAEMRGDTRAAITREVMMSKPLSTEQKMLGESEALRLNAEINRIYMSKHGSTPVLDKRPIGQ
ncbi:hypothetical protein OZ429_16740 [Xanthomonas fragariae]|nr:hypothetical protein [Xanthomonas fragariae]WAT14595.1 hypothetical protein OZ429_16740 [Xanthomonas fragariae]